MVKLRWACPLVVLVVLFGCTTVAPPYQPSMQNVGTLQRQRPAQVKVGDFVAAGEQKEKINQLTIRGGTFLSPYKESYVEYLREALRQELSLAGMLNDNAAVEVSGAFLRNEFDASGVSLAFAVMEARLTVKNNGIVRYSKTKSVRHEWESAFAAFTAVPKAHQNYAVSVQKLLRSFYDDVDFQKALK